MANVALVTARAVDTDIDLAPLLGALRNLGIQASDQCWDDPAVDWTAFDLVVLRSPWDYVPRYAEFLRWLQETETRVPVLNPSSVVTWNTDKHYLRDLQLQGLPVVPTIFVEARTAECALPDLEGEIVVKPVVGAGSKDAARHSSVSNAHRHLIQLLAQGRAALVQPYMTGIDTYGETGLVYFNGKFSHAFRKSAILALDVLPTDELFAPEKITPGVPTPAERDLADAAIAARAKDLLYARVDIVPGPDTTPLIIELELTEPSYFVGSAPGSAERFARAVKERLTPRFPEPGWSSE